MIRGILNKILKEKEAELEAAGDGLAAIEKYQSFRLDLTIIDINMPKMDGLEAILQIKTKDPKAKFIILSLSSRQDEVVTAKTLNVDAYVIKPFRIEDFIETITKAID